MKNRGKETTRIGTCLMNKIIIIKTSIVNTIDHKNNNIA